MSARDITVACVLTPSGRGAVAVVAVVGKATVTAVGRYFQAANQRVLGDQPIGRIVYGFWVNHPGDNHPGDNHPGDSREGEDLVVCRRSENALEIHCHGGRQSSAQIVADLADAGCTVIDAKQWLAHQHECPLASAAHDAMTQATTFRTAAILLAQFHGALRREIEAIAFDLAADKTDAATVRLECLLQRSEFGRHLTEPWRVVIAGQPNVGKSSLINALVGYERAIVFNQPGTTRDVVSSTTAIDGWPVELSDTAGLHETTETIETAGIELARARLATADLVVWVLDAVELDLSGESSSWSLAQQQAAAVCVQLALQRTQIVINKIDLADFSTTKSRSSPTTKNRSSVGTCAVTSAGIEQLLSTISTRLVPVFPPLGVAVPFSSDQIAALQQVLDAARREEFNAATEMLGQMINVFD